MIYNYRSYGSSLANLLLLGCILSLARRPMLPLMRCYRPMGLRLIRPYGPRF